MTLASRTRSTPSIWLIFSMMRGVRPTAALP